MSKTIALTGMMGAGKSTIGSAVAAALGRGFVDTDALIAERAGMAVADFIAANGMDAFRQLESRVVSQACAHNDMVVALGGGSLLANDTRDAIADTTFIVGLDAEVKVLACRLKDASQRDARPLLHGDGPVEDLLAPLLDERASHYQQVSAVQVSAAQPPKHVVAAVLQAAADAGALTPSELESLL